MRSARLLCILALLALTATTALAQRGKISGVVTDAATGDTMPGVNVVIVGTTQGGVADVDGFYFINNVRPGAYVLQASRTSVSSPASPRRSISRYGSRPWVLRRSS